MSIYGKEGIRGGERRGRIRGNQGELLVGEANVSGAEGPAQVGRVKDVAEREDAPDYGVVESGTDAMSDMLQDGSGLSGWHPHADVVGDYGSSASMRVESEIGLASSHQSGARAVALRDLSARLEYRGTSKDPSPQPG